MTWFRANTRNRCARSRRWRWLTVPKRLATSDAETNRFAIRGEESCFGGDLAIGTVSLSAPNRSVRCWISWHPTNPRFWKYRNWASNWASRFNELPYTTAFESRLTYSNLEALRDDVICVRLGLTSPTVATSAAPCAENLRGIGLLDTVHERTHESRSSIVTWQNPRTRP